MLTVTIITIALKKKDLTMKVQNSLCQKTLVSNKLYIDVNLNWKTISKTSSNF